MKNYKLNHRCPFCDAEHDRAGSLTGGRKPKAGDLGLCIKCGEWLIFTGNDGEQRKPTDDEYAEIAATPECDRVRQAWKETHP